MASIAPLTEDRSSLEASLLRRPFSSKTTLRAKRPVYIYQKRGLRVGVKAFSMGRGLKLSAP